MNQKRCTKYLGTIALQCAVCSKNFNRPVSVHKAIVKKGTKVFCCSKSCSSKYKLRFCHKPRELWDKTGKKLDELSPFRATIKKCKSRKKWETTIDAQYIKELWTAQHGKCALTGIPMLPLPRHCNEIKGPRQAFAPSLDRINSSLGYVAGNVQWVCTIANLAKADFAEDDFFKMCMATAERRAGRLP